MCTPTAFVALTIASGIASYSAARASANAQEAAAQQSYDLNKANAEQSAMNQYRQIRQRQAQENEKSAQEIQEVSRRALKARSTAMVQAAEKGVSGRNIADLFQDFERQESEYRNISLRNRAFRELAYDDQLEAVRLGTQSRIINALPAPVAKPSLIATALKIGGQIAGGVGDFQDPDPAQGVPQGTG